MELPVLGRVAAGAPIGADAGAERHVLLDRTLFANRPDYLLRVKGDSMRDDGIFDGDLVAVQRTRDARNGQVVVARIDGEVTIQRFEDRTSVGEGKSVSVRVDLGGRRLIKKKKTKIR